MKPWPLGDSIRVFIRPATFAQKPDFSETIPKYDISKEVAFKGVVGELGDHVCPIGGDMRFHLILKIGNETYEVHVAPRQWGTVREDYSQGGNAWDLLQAGIRFGEISAAAHYKLKTRKLTRCGRKRDTFSGAE